MPASKKTRSECEAIGLWRSGIELASLDAPMRGQPSPVRSAETSTKLRRAEIIGKRFHFSQQRPHSAVNNVPSVDTMGSALFQRNRRRGRKGQSYLGFFGHCLPL